MKKATPNYWVLNQLNHIFNNIPKKRMGLTNDPVFMEEQDFFLGDLEWIPRRNSIFKYIVNKLSISNEESPKPTIHKRC